MRLPSPLFSFSHPSQFNTTRNDDLFLKKMEERREKINSNTDDAIGDLNRCIGNDDDDDSGDSSDEKTLKSSPPTVRRAGESSKSSAPPPPPAPGRSGANGHRPHKAAAPQHSSPPKSRQALDSGEWLVCLRRRAGIGQDVR